MQIGKTKDLGSYNKPSAAVHAGALAAGTLPQYNTLHTVVTFLPKRIFECDRMSVLSIHT